MPNLSRKHIVASVALMMLLIVLLWHQQDNVTGLVSSTLGNAKPNNSPTTTIPEAAKETSQGQKDQKPDQKQDQKQDQTQDQKQDQKDQKQEIDDNKDDKNETAPVQDGGHKTKERFWSSKGHLLPSVWDYKRPKNIRKIMALVFFGRRQPVSILDCYLKVRSIP